MNKNATLKCNYKWYFLPVLLLWSAGALFAQTEKKRTIEKIFDGKTALWAEHQYGDLILKRGTGGQIKAVLTITGASKNEAELTQFLDEFELLGTEAPDNKVDIKTSGQIKNWKTLNGRSTIKFCDGQSYSGIQKFNMTLEIFVPKLRYATLENKYAAIKAEDGTAENLEIKLYDGAITAPGNFENLSLDIKYSKGTIGNYTNCNAQMYDSDVRMGNGGNLKMDSKYSGLKIGVQQSLTLVCFDDDYQVEGVKGPTDINDKYSEFTFLGDLGNARFTLYDSKIEAKNGASLQISDSKYTEYNLQEFTSIHFDASFDDAVQIAKVGTLSASSSKYTEYAIGGLWKSINFPSSFDDAIKIGTVGSTFEGMVFDGKYTDVTVPIPGAVKYEIDASLKYGKLLFPESIMESAYYKEKNDETTLQAKVKGAVAGAPKVVIKSFDGVIKLD
jgi:hypothetical protein